MYIAVPLLKHQMISNLLLKHIADHAPGTDREGVFPHEAFTRMREEGLLSITLPGHPLDFNSGHTADLLQLLKQIGSADLAVGRVYEGHINALYLIHLFAGEGQKQRWYSDAEKQHLFGVWNTQADDGIRLHPDGNKIYTLQGSKTFSSGAGFITRPLITGSLHNGTGNGWQMCIVPVEKAAPVQQDTSFWQPMGMKASVSYRMDFTGVRIGEDDLLGQSDDYYRQPAFSGGAIRFAAVQLGAAEALLDATIQYLQDLGRITDPFQKSRVAEMTWLIASGNQWIDTAGNNTDRWLQAGSKTAEIVAYANMTRTAIEEICLRIMQLAERSVGARGLMRPLPFERIHRDLTFYLRQPAPDASLTAIADHVFNQNISAHELWR